MNPQPIVIRSCFNCKHLVSWYYPPSREDPGDQGYECGHKEGAWYVVELDDKQFSTEEEECQFIAAQCPIWEQVQTSYE